MGVSDCVGYHCGCCDVFQCGRAQPFDSAPAGPDLVKVKIKYDGTNKQSLKKPHPILILFVEFQASILGATMRVRCDPLAAFKELQRFD